MTEHNINEAGPAIGQILGKASKATGLLGGLGGGEKKKKNKGTGSIGQTSGRVNVKPIQGEELEVVCDFLLDKGYASTGVEAENIYEHMSAEWKEYILNS